MFASIRGWVLSFQPLLLTAALLASSQVASAHEPQFKKMHRSHTSFRIANPVQMRGLNPQPEPPGIFRMSGNHDSTWLNPQPEPPGSFRMSGNHGSAWLNPQPEPPGSFRMGGNHGGMRHNLHSGSTHQQMHNSGGSIQFSGRNFSFRIQF